ncbi:hypothetical protein [Pontibacter korlensis]|nr:hypothetical protein [Pontibacter korlensis]
MTKIILLLSFIALSYNSYACKCNTYASIETFMEERYSASDFVVSAKVEFVKDSLTKGNYIMSADPTYWRQGGYNAVLKVGKVYKGDIDTDTIEIIPNWSNCSQYFKTGHTYIVFVYVNKKGEFTTNVCSGSFSTIQVDKCKAFQKIRKE